MYHCSSFFFRYGFIILDSQDSVRRKQAPKEDIKLVQALIKHYNEVNDRLKNKFQPGYLRILKVKLSKTLPNAGIKTKSHIESILKTLKKIFK